MGRRRKRAAGVVDGGLAKLAGRNGQTGSEACHSDLIAKLGEVRARAELLGSR